MYWLLFYLKKCHPYFERNLNIIFNLYGQTASLFNIMLLHMKKCALAKLISRC